MRVDVSIVSFVLVLIIAIPVTALRSQTYSIGYEIAELKSTERHLREDNLALKARLALTEAKLLAIPNSEGKLWNYPEVGRIGVAYRGMP
jgi:hypothetical protein